MKLLARATALAILAVSGTALAAAPSGLKVRPWTYDPDRTRAVDSAWVANAGVEGHGLFLEKATATATNASAGATVDGAEGLTLTELGFDYRNDGHCGAGAPRFNVYTTAGTYFFFGCAYGVHTPVPGHADWTRVRFGNADAFPADGVTAFPGFGTAVVTGIDVVFDEGTDQGVGYVMLDNIDVNGTLVGKPGNAK
jgi:hypothetical protein